MLVGKTLNGRILCSVYATYTKKGNLSEICVLPLDKMLDPMFDKVFDKSVLLLDREDQRMTKRYLHPMEGSDVFESFDLWYDEIIRDGQILPLAFDWPSLKTELDKFFTKNVADFYFSDTVRDIKVVGTFYNDLTESNDQIPLPFPKQTFKYLGNCCDIKLEKDPSPLSCCIYLSKVYKKMVTLDLSRSLISF